MSGRQAKLEPLDEPVTACRAMSREAKATWKPGRVTEFSGLSCAHTQPR